MESGEAKSKREKAREKLISDEPFEKEEEEYHGMDSDRAEECSKVVEGCLKVGAYDIAKKFIEHVKRRTLET